MVTRRKFLKMSAAGAAGLLTAGPLSLLPTVPAHGGVTPDLEIALKSLPAQVPILPGPPTPVWRYTGALIKGRPGSLSGDEESYLGPTIRVRRGDRVRIRFENRLRAESIIHWHGLHVPEAADGHPRFAVPTGGQYDYDFSVKNRAGTYWYHPHPHGQTGHQVYGGMAGFFLVTDDEEQAARLPTEDHDIPLVIQDRTLDSDNRLVYLTGGMMERMIGMLGDRILVNGKPDFTLAADTRAYRLRLLNGSNSRIYRLAWSDGTPLAIIGSDGGLLEKPVFRDYVYLAPAERIDLWADFSRLAVGPGPMLLSLPFGSGAPTRGPMGRGRGIPKPPNGAPFALFKIDIRRTARESLALPERLSEPAFPGAETAVNRSAPRRFRLFMRHMTGTINGRTFQMEAVAEDEIVRLGTNEIWEIVNVPAGGHMMGMMNQPHPIHLHGLQFRVLERRGVNHDGYVDAGWKDTVLIMPGEGVRLLVRFRDYPGMFLYHCHNLEHEDAGMMRNYYIRSA